MHRRPAPPTASSARLAHTWMWWVATTRRTVLLVSAGGTWPRRGATTRTIASVALRAGTLARAGVTIRRIVSRVLRVSMRVCLGARSVLSVLRVVGLTRMARIM